MSDTGSRPAVVSDPALTGRAIPARSVIDHPDSCPSASPQRVAAGVHLDAAIEN
ncbi:hypothetical protein [Nocardia sp. NPDC051463]|uniref:hypothetical protein n=1 Tax=Nocardia sp. NPDC051463 TaxID=3154845 RepID=UPI00344C1549